MESKGSADTSTALVVIELPVDGMLVNESSAEELQAEPRRRARLLARSRRALARLARGLNPAEPTRIAVATSGRAAKSVVVKLHPRRLARAAKEFRRIGAEDLERLARGVARGTKGVAGRFSFNSPWKARRVRVVAATVRKLVLDVSPDAANRMARQATRLAQESVAQLDPRRVEEAVRRAVDAVDFNRHGRKGRSSDGGRINRAIQTAIAKIGPERAVRIAGEATRVLALLLDKLDPDHVGRVIGDLVAAARSANDKVGRLRLVGFLAALVGEVGRAFKSVAKNIEARDVAVVVLVVLTAAPELLIAVGVSAAALRVLTQVIQVIIQVFPERKGGPRQVSLEGLGDVLPAAPEGSGAGAPQRAAGQPE